MLIDKELNIALREMARGVGLCDEWYGQWKDEDTIDECLDRYVRGFDFAVKNDWPRLEFIREHFSTRMDVLHRHNIFLDEDVHISDAGNGYYIFLGKCNGKLIANGFKAVTVYCRHDSSIDVGSFGGARVFVTYYDRSTGNCMSDEYSKYKRYNRNTGDGRKG